MYAWQTLAPLPPAEAEAARPGWPWIRTRLTYTEFGLGQLDEEFALALQRAAELGCGRLAVDPDLAHLGLFGWTALSLDQRRLTLEAAGRTVAHSRREVRQL